MTKSKGSKKRIAQRNRILRAQEYKCFYCHDPLPKELATSDHVFPKADGFSLVRNSVASCKPCNKAKGCISPSLDIILRAVKLYEKMGKNFYPFYQQIESVRGPFISYYDMLRGCGIQPTKNIERDDEGFYT